MLGVSLARTEDIAPAAIAGTTAPVALGARLAANAYVPQRNANAASTAQEKAVLKESAGINLTPKDAAGEKPKIPAVIAVLLESANAAIAAKTEPSAPVTLASAATAVPESRKPPAVIAALLESANAARLAKTEPSAPVTLASAATAVLENKRLNQKPKPVGAAEATNQQR